MASIAEAAASLKSSIRSGLAPSCVLSACREAGHRWRVRCLDPVRTIWLFALQVLDGNTACAHVARLLPERQVSDSAYCQARARLPLRVFQHLFERLARSLQANARRPAWHGRRVLIIDGSSCSMPDNPKLDAAFGHPRGQAPGCSFPVMKLLGLFEASTGLLIELIMDRLYVHDASLLRSVLGHLRRRDVVVADRGLAGWCQMALLRSHGVDAIIRLHPRRLVDLRQGRAVGVKDRVLLWAKPSHRPDWMDQAAFESFPQELEVRVLEYQVEERGHRTRTIRLVTTLLDAKRYPKEQLAQRYFQRWEVEVNFRHLKRTLKLDILKCATPNGVRKEAYMFAIIYNLARATMLQAAERQRVPADRISFVDVLRWLLRRQPGDPMPIFKVNPRRTGRSRPRTVKRRPKRYSLQQPRHRQMP